MVYRAIALLLHRSLKTAPPSILHLHCTSITVKIRCTSNVAASLALRLSPNVVKQTSGWLSQSQSDSFNHVHIPRKEADADGPRATRTAFCAAKCKVAGGGGACFLEILPSHGTILALHFPSIVVPSTFLPRRLWYERAVGAGCGRLRRTFLVDLRNRRSVKK